MKVSKIYILYKDGRGKEGKMFACEMQIILHILPNLHFDQKYKQWDKTTESWSETSQMTADQAAWWSHYVITVCWNSFPTLTLFK